MCPDPPASNTWCATQLASEEELSVYQSSLGRLLGGGGANTRVQVDRRVDLQGQEEYLENPKAQMVVLTLIQREAGRGRTNI